MCIGMLIYVIKNLQYCIHCTVYISFITLRAHHCALTHSEFEISIRPPCPSTTTIGCGTAVDDDLAQLYVLCSAHTGQLAGSICFQKPRRLCQATPMQPGSSSLGGGRSPANTFPISTFAAPLLKYVSSARGGTISPRHYHEGYAGGDGVSIIK